MNFHSSDPSCRFRSLAEAERYAEKCDRVKKWESYGVYLIDGRVSYSPPKDTTRIKRMCSACRRRQVHGKARFCQHAGCIRKRVLKAKDGNFAHSAPSTYGGS